MLYSPMVLARAMGGGTKWEGRDWVVERAMLALAMMGDVGGGLRVPFVLATSLCGLGDPFYSRIIHVGVGRPMRVACI